ncbi:MAG: hypothetical protein IJH47_00800, partial [Oscillospiraceae bacterium]|nr:hypothetical protein [Oscillospiraceae bacterium]
ARPEAPAAESARDWPAALAPREEPVKETVRAAARPAAEAVKPVAEAAKPAAKAAEDDFDLDAILAEFK